MRARYLVVVVAALASALALDGAGCHAGDPDRAVVDLDGRAVDPLTAPLTALVFTSPGCPIANRYAPELQRIAARFRPGVAFFLVYPDASAAEARAHLTAYALSLPALRDPRHRLVTRARVEVTPEAALFRGHTLVWHGRIDDRYVDIGRERPAATRHDLEEALDALVAGRAPPPPAPAVGCVIASP